MNIDEICTHLKNVRGSEQQRVALCPAHTDNKPSLSIAEGDNGSILLKCHAGCRTEDIVDAMGLTVKDLFIQPTAAKDFKGAYQEKHIVDTYRYKDAHGRECEKVRYSDKSFVWQQSDGKCGKVYSRKGIEPSLYHTNYGDLPSAVYLCEGEKDANNLSKAGLYAVSVPDGAGSKWHKAYTEALRGKAVCIIPDNDKPGRELAGRAAHELYGNAGSVYVIDLSKLWPGIPEHGDVTDLITNMGAAEATAAIVKLIGQTPEYKQDKTAEENEFKLQTCSAVDLQKIDLPAVHFVAEGMLPTGLSLIASPPKYGKSWLMLDLCLCVASGRDFLNQKTNKCGCLYLALEDSLQRLKDRMQKVLNGWAAPEHFDYATSALAIDHGLVKQLEAYLREHKNTRLIVIDTLQKVRGAANGKESAYGADYREIGALKTFADQHGICLLLVHHLRKAADDTDPFNRISGTAGIFGAVDTAFVMAKAKRGDTQTTLSIVGRDVESSDTILEFDKTSYRWRVLGDVDYFTEQRARLEYSDSLIIKTIKKLLEQTPGGWRGTSKELMQAGQYITKTFISTSTQKLGKELNELEKPLFEYDHIIHERAKNGSGGGVHRFFYQTNVDQDEEFVGADEGFVGNFIEINDENCPFS